MGNIFHFIDKMIKKILLILGILVVIGIAWFLVMRAGEPTTEGESRVGFSIKDFFPFGRDPGESPEPTEESLVTGEVGESLPVAIPRLRKISREPVAGFSVRSVGTTTIIRFVERGTGNVYEASSDSVSIDRLTNTTIPKIIRAFWLPDASGFLAQTLVPESETIETHFVKLNQTATSTNENLTKFNTTISNLPTGIKEIAISPSGDKIFYYTIQGSASNWYSAKPDGTNVTSLFRSSLTEWLPTWISGAKLMMQTKGSGATTGYTYIFDTTTKNLQKTGFGFFGISAKPNNDGSRSLVSNGDPQPSLFMINNTDVSLNLLKVKTLSDKCVWTKEKAPTIFCAIPTQFMSGTYPDAWYQGEVTTEDTVRKIDALNDIYYNVANLSKESNEKIDVIDINISKDEDYLVFRNKRDGFLWLLRIAE